LFDITIFYVHKQKTTHRVLRYGESPDTFMVVVRHNDKFWLMGATHQGHQQYVLVAADAADRDHFTFLFLPHEVQTALAASGCAAATNAGTVPRAPVSPLCNIDAHKQTLMDALTHRRRHEDGTKTHTHTPSVHKIR
jgi:hypothetical protein